MFYRHPSADMLWQPEDVNAAYAAATRIFHYGSISLIGEPSRSATLAALTRARARRCPHLLRSQPAPGALARAQAARKGMLGGWRHADLVKVSEEELAFLTGATDLGDGATRAVARSI